MADESALRVQQNRIDLVIDKTLQELIVTTSLGEHFASTFWLFGDSRGIFYGDKEMVTYA